MGEHALCGLSFLYGPLGRLSGLLQGDWSLTGVEGRVTSFEGWGQVYIFGDDSSVEQTEHAVPNVILSDGWWVRERVISESFRQDALRL